MSDTFTLYDGSEMTVLERPERPTDPLVMRFRLVNEGSSPPLHEHPFASETFEVEEGSFELHLDGEWRTFPAGESATVAPGRPHTFRNRSGDVVVVRNVHDPHHDFESYIRTVAALSHRHRAVKPTNPAVAMRFAMMFDRHDDLIRPCGTVMRPAMSALAATGRLLRLSLPPPA